MLSKILLYVPFIWNYVLVHLINGKYSDFPTIVGFLKALGRNGEIIFGKNVVIISSQWINPIGSNQSTRISLGKGAIIKVGNNVGISNAIIFARQSITIEDNVLIGGGCQILDNDFHSLLYSERIGSDDQNYVVSSPIVIKKGAFIGCNSIILKGVTIGERSIIAAGAVVTKSVPPDEVWGGNPARFIRKI